MKSITFGSTCTIPPGIPYLFIQTKKKRLFSIDRYRRGNRGEGGVGRSGGRKQRGLDIVAPIHASSPGLT